MARAKEIPMEETSPRVLIRVFLFSSIRRT
jgi:hypothetical protein